MKSRIKLMLWVGALAGSIFVSGIRAQSSSAAESSASPTGTTAPRGPATASALTPFRNQPVRLHRRAAVYYDMVWGVDSLSVKAVESGEILRFTYRVVDPERAKALHDKKVEPSLIAPERGVRLVVPSFEKVGKLRQSATPEG